MFFHLLRKIASNDDRFLTRVESDVHGACGRQWVVCRQTKGADMCRLVCTFSVGDPIAASRVGEVVVKARLRKCVRWRRSVDGLIM